MIFRYKLLAYTTALLSFGVVHLSSNFATVSGRKSSTSSSDSEYSTPCSTPLNKTFEIPSRSCSSTPDSAPHHESEKNQSTPPSPFARINSQPSTGDHSQEKQDSTHPDKPPRPTKTPDKVVFPAGRPVVMGDTQYPDQAAKSGFPGSSGRQQQPLNPEDQNTGQQSQKQEKNWGKLIHFFHLFIPFPRDIRASEPQPKSESTPDTSQETVVENPRPQDNWDRLICFFGRFIPCPQKAQISIPEQRACLESFIECCKNIPENINPQYSAYTGGIISVIAAGWGLKKSGIPFKDISPFIPYAIGIPALAGLHYGGPRFIDQYIAEENPEIAQPEGYVNPKKRWKSRIKLMKYTVATGITSYGLWHGANNYFSKPKIGASTTLPALPAIPSSALKATI